MRLFCGSTLTTDSARAHVELATFPTAVAAGTLAAVPAASDSMTYPRPSPRDGHARRAAAPDNLGVQVVRRALLIREARLVVIRRIPHRQLAHLDGRRAQFGGRIERVVVDDGLRGAARLRFGQSYARTSGRSRTSAAVESVCGRSVTVAPVTTSARCTSRMLVGVVRSSKREELDRREALACRRAPR